MKNITENIRIIPIFLMIIKYYFTSTRLKTSKWNITITQTKKSEVDTLLGLKVHVDRYCAKMNY